MFSKTYEALGQTCMPVCLKKEKILLHTQIFNYILYSMENWNYLSSGLTLLDDFSLKNFILSKNKQANKQKPQQLSLSQKLLTLPLHEDRLKTPKPKFTAWHLTIS